LSGTATDDGLPTGSTLTTTWSKVSGPGTVTFGNVSAGSTTATFSAPGSYVLRLTASDTVLSNTDDTTIVVNPAPAPPPPPSGSLPGLKDFATHAPPASGTYVYNAFRPGQPGFLAVGQSYVDPVFGSTISRLTDVGGANEGDSNLYVKNGFWNADGAYHTFTNTRTGTNDVIDASTGAIVRSSVDFTFDSSFDPVDPDILWKWSGANLRKYRISTGSETTEKTFPAPLQTLGGSTDWISADGQYFLLKWSGAAHIWKRNGDVIYSGAPSITIGGHWAGITPDGNYIVAFTSSGIVSYAINHGTRTVSTTPVMFWSVNVDDHGDLVSASDGKNYLVLYEYNNTGAVYAVDITRNQSSATPDQQRAANRRLIADGFSGAFDDYHISCVARGTLRDWCVISTVSSNDTFNSSPAWQPFKSEIFSINVLTGAATRHAHHRSRSVMSSYHRFPRANVNWDGTGIIFGSNYNFQGSNTNYSDLYRIR
jgi:hypothetical protein